MVPFRSAAALAFAFVVGGPALAQTTWFVDASAVPPGNGTPGSPYASIQFAHDQAATLSGDTLSIAAGTYVHPLWFHVGKTLRLDGAGAGATVLTGGLDVAFAGGFTLVEDLTFRGEPVRFDQSDVLFERVVIEEVDGVGPAASVLDSDSFWTDVTFARNSGGLYVGSSTTATLTNVTFADSGGYAAPALRADFATLWLEDCSFTDNHVSEESGGALHLSNCQTTIEDCTFTRNVATFAGRYGGAILQANGSLSLAVCDFEDNYSGRGGALAILGTGACVAQGLEFSDNTAQSDGAQMFHSGQGGAVWVGAGSSFTGVSCTFESNQVLPPLGTPFPDDQLGGALFSDMGTVNLSDSVFRGNKAGLGGSAVHGAAKLVRCQVVANTSAVSGSAIFGVTLELCTVVDNDMATGWPAVFDSLVNSSIIWGNANGQTWGQTGGSTTTTFSCVQWGEWGQGNISDDPQFIDPANGDFSLTLGSPCIDTAAPSMPLDPDLTPADMGALPFTWPSIGASYCSTNPNSSGQTAQIAALGSVSVADDFLRVQATQTAVNQVGLFMMSQNQGFVPFFNGSQGNLCVSAPIVRLTNTPGSVSSSGALGLLNLRVGLTTLPAGLQVLPGQTWHFQSWFRDSIGGQSTSNTSDAVSVTFQ